MTSPWSVSVLFVCVLCEEGVLVVMNLRSLGWMAAAGLRGSLLVRTSDRGTTSVPGQFEVVVVAGLVLWWSDWRVGLSSAAQRWLCVRCRCTDS